MIYRVWWLTAPKVITVLYFLSFTNANNCYMANKDIWIQENRFTKQRNKIKFHLDSAKTNRMPKFVDSTFLDQQAWGD